MSQHIVPTNQPGSAGRRIVRPTVLSEALERIADLEYQLGELRRFVLAKAPSLDTLTDTSSRAPAEDVSTPSLLGPGYWEVTCLGDFQLRCGGSVVAPCPSRRGQSILKYLLASRHYAATSDMLIECFWQNAEPSAGAHSLRVAVHALRHSLRGYGPDGSDETILFCGGRYALNPALVIEQDVDRFRAAYKWSTRVEAAGPAAEVQCAFEEARACYTGDYLADSLYEDWAAGQRAALKDTHLTILSRLGASFMRSSEWERAADCCNEILVADPYREDAYRQLMRCYAARGRPVDVQRTYDTCYQYLRRDLSLLPARETTDLYRHLIGKSSTNDQTLIDH